MPAFPISELGRRLAGHGPNRPDEATVTRLMAAPFFIQMH